jgi:hypothetical protein
MNFSFRIQMSLPRDLAVISCEQSPLRPENRAPGRKRKASTHDVNAMVPA